MTVEQVIINLCDVIRSKFYAGRLHDFMRDLRGLKWAISSWGRVCNERGWQVEPATIFQEILAILNDIQASDRDVQYLPIYLKGAIARRLGQRAEEISDESKRLEKQLSKIISGLKPGEVRPPTTNEILIALHQDMRRQLRRNKALPAAGTRSKQKELL